MPDAPKTPEPKSRIQLITVQLMDFAGVSMLGWMAAAAMEWAWKPTSWVAGTAIVIFTRQTARYVEKLVKACKAKNYLNS